MKKGILLSLLLMLVVLGGYYFWPDTSDQQIQASISAVESLQGETEGYLRAEGPRDFTFPEDHGPHPGYRTEWWYYTGNLFTESGRQFGYQLTFFRNQLSPPDSMALKPSSPDWKTNQLYMAHFALSDIQNQQHYDFERFSRGALELAGARADSFRVWLEDWQAFKPQNAAVQPNGSMPVHLEVAANGMGIKLQLDPTKPLTLQGERGYDQKGTDPGNASYYLSFTRMQTSGTVTVDGESYPVNGRSWMDHEWSTSALGSEQVGWDWFSIQLSNGYDLMYYRLRNTDGSVSQFTSGSLIDPEGNKIKLDKSEVHAKVLDRWTSSHSGARYPVEWELKIPDKNLELRLKTTIPDQEMNISFTYYEGSFSVSGSMDGEAVGGDAYIEMTGYGDQRAFAQ